MAPRSIWNGAVAFGMVAIPVKLYPATQSKSLSFVTIHNTCHTRLHQKRYCPTHDADVDQKEVGRAYEYAKDQHVIMEDSDFEKVQVPSTHTIEITKFVELSSVDPLYFDRSYALEPESVGAKPFHLLKQALENSGKVAVGKVSLSPNPPKDTDGRREDSGRGWVRELQGRWPGVLGRWEAGGRSSVAAQGP